LEETKKVETITNMVGLTDNNCPLTRNPVISTIDGAVPGALLATSLDRINPNHTTP
jgi:hypothetical protein